MKKRMLTVLKPVLFLLLGLAMLWKVQGVMMPNWPMNEQSIAAIESGRVPAFDVLFLGASHVQCGVSPMELYEKYGIRSFNLAGAGQMISGSYFLLEQAYESYDIETVFLDVSTMFIDESTHSESLINGYWRWILDNLPFGSLKYRMAKEYASNKWSDGFLSAMLPILSYHTSWSSLTAENFRKLDGVSYHLGQAMWGKIVPTPAHYTLENIDYATNFIHEFHSGRKVETINGTASTEIIEKDLDTTSISDLNLAYLLKIKLLCEEHGSNLILFKVPTMRPPQWSSNAWTRVKLEMISELAKQHGLEFWDLQFNSELSLSLATDSWDGGVHLNMLGAEKVSDYIGARIIGQHLAFRKTGPDYDKNLAIYQKVSQTVKLQTIGNFREYLRFLKESGADWTIVVAATDDYTLGLTEEIVSDLKNFGLPLITESEFRDSYIGVISSGETVYEAISDYELEYEIELPGARAAIMSKNGWMQDPGCSIRINGTEYSQSINGLNIVVYDHETGCVLDTVSFNINEHEAVICNQDTNNSLLRGYESALCEKEG